LWWAAEEAKKKLSFEPYVRVREDALLIEDGNPSTSTWKSPRRVRRDDPPLVESTFDSVSKALGDAHKSPETSTPFFWWAALAERPSIASAKGTDEPGAAQDMHPDLCVALARGY